MMDSTLLGVCFVAFLFFPIVYVLSRPLNAKSKTVDSDWLIVEGYHQLGVDIAHRWEQAKLAKKRQKIVDHLSWLYKEREGLTYMSKHGKEPWKSGAAQRLREIDGHMEEVQEELRRFDRFRR